MACSSAQLSSVSAASSDSQPAESARAGSSFPYRIGTLGPYSESSRSLVGRGRVEPAWKTDLRKGDFTEAVKEKLRTRGWSVEELEELERQPELLFSWGFFEQVQEKQCPEILKFFPPDAVRQLRHQVGKAIRDLNAIELTYETQAVSDPIFSDLQPGHLTKDQSRFLQEQGWTEEECQQLQTLRLDDLVQELVQQALNMNKGLVVYNISKKYAAHVFGICTIRRDELEDSIHFIDEHSQDPELI